MKKATIILLIAISTTACLGKGQTITVKSEKHGISVTGTKDDITVEGEIKLDDDTTIEFKTEEDEE